MRKVLFPLFVFTANPALAHHEVIVATSLVPLTLVFAAVPIAGFTAWLQRRKK